MERGPDRDPPAARLGDRPGFDEWANEVMARLKERREPPPRQRSKTRTLFRAFLDRRAP